MRLTKIKLAGFKSFVDPTSIPVKSPLVAVVGPNGCGKSNIIDAVRWVMGEMSARQLRGESMADVIFNGSSSRKPVGQASVELIFDNSEGRLTGQYAQYGEIGIRRVVSRDGQSGYFLNGARCRRRDITDLFLGTGLGPHSYAIIEQGTISRLIEARPDDLRLFLEEAAGISRYKERRRETEIRLRATRDNVSRINDILSELVAQLKHLEQQAETAAKYTRLKEQETLFKVQAQALRWRALDLHAQEEMRALQQLATEAEKYVAEMRGHDSALERLRVEHERASQALNAAQAEFYGLGAQIARLEQAIKGAQETRQQRLRDLEVLDRDIGAVRSELDAEETQCSDVELRLQAAKSDQDALAMRAAEAAARSSEAEEAMHRWQLAWEDLAHEAAGPTQAAHVEHVRLQQLERQCQQTEHRLERLREEQHTSALEPAAEALARSQAEAEEAEIRAARLDDALAGTTAAAVEQRSQNGTAARAVDETRGTLHELRGRLASLRAMQSEAMGGRQEAVTRWLEQQGLAEAPRLVDRLQVEPGWELATESVMAEHLDAICVQGFGTVEESLGAFGGGKLALFDTAASAGAPHGPHRAALGERVQAPWPLDGLVAGIYAVETLAEGLSLRSELAAHESLVTRDGIRVGRNWLRLVRDSDPRAGVLSRVREIRQLEEQEGVLAERLNAEEMALEQGRVALRELEEARESLAQQSREAHHRLGGVKAHCRAEATRVEHLRARLGTLSAESEELSTQSAHLGNEIAAARARLEEATAAAGALGAQREAMQREREALQMGLGTARTQARHDQEAAHRAALQVEALGTSLDSARKSLVRLGERLEREEARRGELVRACEQSVQPLEEMRGELQQLLERRGAAETALTAARKMVEELQEKLAENERARHAAATEADRLKALEEEARLRWQEYSVRARALDEDLAAAGADRGDLLSGLPEDADSDAWQVKLERLQDRIQRLGPVNLAAVDEFRVQSQRKEYLDGQLADLDEAVRTLEGAIRTIDKETRQRFSETFDQVNRRLQELFPRLFGGGQAHLEMTGEEVLDAGVAIMARPPGKRISHIHLLSGGEKALTAVALVFAMFELNPAPFCLLDEVDAPLDDANVGRFCQLVQEMSARTQFLFVTHNKVSMELADQLTGVTMQEPGVSRLVAVDVEEAMAMAAVQA
jgi:chromosome segregation protein